MSSSSNSSSSSRGRSAPVQLIPGIFLSGYRPFQQPTIVPNLSCRTVVSVLGEQELMTLWPGRRTPWPSIPSAQWLRLNVGDGNRENLLVHLDTACDFIRRYNRSDGNGRVLVNSWDGTSRAPAVIVAYLMQRHRSSLARAHERIVSLRPDVNLGRDLEEQLAVWEQCGYSIWEDRGRTVYAAPYQAWLARRRELEEFEMNMALARLPHSMADTRLD